MHEHVLMFPCALTHSFVCRLVGSERFRQRLLKRKGKLVLLTPPKAEVGVQEVAEYLEPILKAAACDAALGLVSMMLHYLIVKSVVLVGLTGMHKTGCSGELRLVLHIPSSSMS